MFRVGVMAVPSSPTRSPTAWPAAPARAEGRQDDGLRPADRTRRTPACSSTGSTRRRTSDFWSVRAGSDIRLIVHRTEASLLLCYVDHHDEAYALGRAAEAGDAPDDRRGAAGRDPRDGRRRSSSRTSTWRLAPGAGVPCPKPPALRRVAEEELLGYGVPAEWLTTCARPPRTRCWNWPTTCPRRPPRRCSSWRRVATPTVAPARPRRRPTRSRIPMRSGASAWCGDVEELERALDYPWEKWTVFLHPAQRESVERDYGGPARVSGSAGTGKTIVALHRAVFLARANPDARVLLTTFSETLANALTDQAPPADRQRAAPRRADRSALPRRRRPAALPDELRSPASGHRRRDPRAR